METVTDETKKQLISIINVLEHILSTGLLTVDDLFSCLTFSDEVPVASALQSYFIEIFADWDTCKHKNFLYHGGITQLQQYFGPDFENISIFSSSDLMDDYEEWLEANGSDDE